LPDDVTLKSEGGVIFIGDKGILMNDTYGSNPRLFPESLIEDAALVPKTYARIPWSHEMNWVKAIKGEAKASSPIEYAAQLTETMLLGIVALGFIALGLHSFACARWIRLLGSTG
jgi:hypothetical protein